MNNIIVIIARGKGRESADWITPKLFSSIDEAQQFCTDITDLDSKYWTYAEVVEDGQEIEPWYGSF